jgi:hypothetical protein
MASSKRTKILSSMSQRRCRYPIESRVRRGDRVGRATTP